MWLAKGSMSPYILRKMSSFKHHIVQYVFGISDWNFRRRVVVLFPFNIQKLHFFLTWLENEKRMVMRLDSPWASTLSNALSENDQSVNNVHKTLKCNRWNKNSDLAVISFRGVFLVIREKFHLRFAQILIISGAWRRGKLLGFGQNAREIIP